MPSWKAEIQLRRRSKVFIPSQKPEQPIKLVETPKWKLDLAERTKNKKDPDVPKVCQQNGFGLMDVTFTARLLIPGGVKMRGCSGWGGGGVRGLIRM